MNIIAMPFVIRRVPDSMVRKAALPQRLQSKFPASTGRVAAFDVLHRLFQRNVFSRGKDEMNVILHDHKLMQQEASLSAVMLQHLNEQARTALRLQQCAATMRDGGYKKRADFLRSQQAYPPARKALML